MKKRPWLWIIVAFLLLSGAWATLITIALNNQPQAISLQKGDAVDGD